MSHCGWWVFTCVFQVDRLQTVIVFPLPIFILALETMKTLFPFLALCTCPLRKGKGLSTLSTWQ